MSQDMVVQLMEAAFELPSESLKMEDIVHEQWGSISLIGFMAAVDEEFGVIVSPQKILNCRTVAEVLAVIEAQRT